MRCASITTPLPLIEAFSRSDCAEPRATVFTVMPRSPNSAAHNRVNASIASYDADYNKIRGTPPRTAPEPMSMTRALVCEKWGMTAWVVRTIARTLVSTMFCEVDRGDMAKRIVLVDACITD